MKMKPTKDHESTRSSPFLDLTITSQIAPLPLNYFINILPLFTVPKLWYKHNVSNITRNNPTYLFIIKI